MLTKLFLIRHPQTDYNLNKRYCGIADIPLNNVGILQARALADYFQNIHVDVVYSSPQRRASEAATFMFGKKCGVLAADDLRELNFGYWDGLTHEEALKRCPDEYSLWLNDPLNARPPEGESLLELKERVMGFLAHILQKDSGKTVAVVSHAGPIRVMLSAALNLGLRNFWNLTVEPASLSYVEYKGHVPVNFSLNLI